MLLAIYNKKFLKNGKESWHANKGRYIEEGSEPTIYPILPFNNK